LNGTTAPLTYTLRPGASPSPGIAVVAGPVGVATGGPVKKNGVVPAGHVRLSRKIAFT